MVQAQQEAQVRHGAKSAQGLIRMGLSPQLTAETFVNLFKNIRTYFRGELQILAKE
jgi:hypothetical protein